MATFDWVSAFCSGDRCVAASVERQLPPRLHYCAYIPPPYASHHKNIQGSVLQIQNKDHNWLDHILIGNRRSRPRKMKRRLDYCTGCIPYWDLS